MMAFHRVLVFSSALAGSLLCSAFAADLNGVLLEPELSDIFHGQADRIYLDGVWKFKPELNVLERKDGKTAVRPDAQALLANSKDLEAGYFREGFDDSRWAEAPVPLSWNVDTDKSAAQFKKTAFAGIGYYRRNFDVPAGKKGLRALLRFASVQSDCKVWLNGVLAGGHSNSSHEGGPYWTFDSRLLLQDFTLDVSSLLNFGGRNTLTVRVVDDGAPVLFNQYPDDGGICGPVRLDFVGQVRFDDIVVAAEPSGSVRIEAASINAGDSAVSMALRAELVPFESARYKSPVKGARSFNVDLGRRSLPAGSAKQSFSFQVDRPVAWSIDTPFLYRLRIYGGSSLLGQTRIGFRKFEVAGTKFLLNGRPLLLRGINSWPGAGGHNLHLWNKGNWLYEALKLDKGMNFNLLRVNNGPYAEPFYEICDELGLLTEDDYAPDTAMLSPEESRAEMIKGINVDRYVRPDGTPNPDGAALLKKWLVRLHNHPSVCLFTAGNEIGFSVGKAHKEAQLARYMDGFYDFVKANDLQGRPVTSSSGLTVWQWKIPVKADFLDFHHYANGNMGWADCGGDNWKWRGFFEKIYGRIDKPVINGECGGYESNATLRPDVKGLTRDGALLPDAYVRWANKLTSDSKAIGYREYLARSYFAAFDGVRSILGKAALVDATAKLYSSYAVAKRRDMPFLEGFVFHDIEPRYLGLASGLWAGPSEIAASAAKCRQNPEFPPCARRLLRSA